MTVHRNAMARKDSSVLRAPHETESPSRLPTTIPAPASLALPRGDNEELRIELASYEGHSFVQARLHFRGTDGEWHPTRKGVTFKLRELGAIVRTLLDVQRATGTDRGEVG